MDTTADLDDDTSNTTPILVDQADTSTSTSPLVETVDSDTDKSLIPISVPLQIK